MYNFLAIFSLLFLQAKATGEFSILHFSNSIDFKGNEELNSDNVADVLKASAGCSVQENSKWSGLIVNDPFNTPQGVVTLVIDGIDSLQGKTKAKSYPLVGDSTHESLNTLDSTLSDECYSRACDVDLSLGADELGTCSEIFSNIKVPDISKASAANLKPKLHSEDKLFLKQIAIINTFAEKLSTINDDKLLPKFITLRMSMEAFKNLHGDISSVKEIITDAIEKLNVATQKAYKDNSLFIVITDKADHSRTKRQAVKDEIDPSKLNLATHYSDDYPVMFNIILWFGVIMAFALLAISYTIATMDPGRDSIIYRMTSTRMKKDN